MQQGYTQPRGVLSARRIARNRAPISWRLRNALRLSWVKGWIATHLIAPFANAWGVATMIARLDAVLIKADGTRISYDALSFRVITDAGVAFLVDDWDDSTTDITNLHFHGCGTLTTAGTLASIKTALLSLAATLTTAGALSRQGQKATAGTLGSSGALARAISRGLAGTLTSSAALADIRTILLSLTGTLSSAGALSRSIDKSLAATLSSAGAVGRAISHAIGGVLSAAGALISAGGQQTVELAYQSDAYMYDSSSGTGSVSGGSVQAGPSQSSPIGSVSGGTVQPGPNQGSPTGSTTGGTIIGPDTIYG